AFITSAFLAFSGGLQDAYTFNTRDHVFANAQTGNLVLMTQNLMEGNIAHSLNYLLPIFAFIVGVFVAEQLQGRLKEKKSLHWRQFIVLIEIITLLLVGFIPGSLNNIANMLVSFSCALQVQSFRKVNGNTYASTMCIGNIKSATARLSAFFRTKDKTYFHQSMHYFGIIIIFAIGAGLGGVISKQFGYPTSWISCAILLIPFILMHERKA
ncbi:MAG: DUF1275 domain-containing protein, partial [Solobacterium sp.]|nr:DUF1275 domain-containing protein [Solobacterium sp.]